MMRIWLLMLGVVLLVRLGGGEGLRGGKKGSREVKRKEKPNCIHLETSQNC